MEESPGAPIIAISCPVIIVLSYMCIVSAVSCLPLLANIINIERHSVMSFIYFGVVVIIMNQNFLGIFLIPDFCIEIDPLILML